MATYSWAAASGDWSTAAAWAPFGVPSASVDAAVIAAAGTYTVTIAASESYSIASLTENAASAALSVIGRLTLTSATVTAGTFGLHNGGSVSVSGSCYQQRNSELRPVCDRLGGW